jgi:hypothetical protein
MRLKLTDVSEVLLHPGDGDIKHLSNVGEFLSHYTAQHPKDSHLYTRRRENLKS